MDEDDLPVPAEAGIGFQAIGPQAQGPAEGRAQAVGVAAVAAAILQRVSRTGLQRRERVVEAVPELEALNRQPVEKPDSLLA